MLIQIEAPDQLMVSWRLGGSEAQNALFFGRRQASFDQHVIDMSNQFAGGKAHLVRVQDVFVEHHRDQFLGGLRGVAAGIRDQPAALLVLRPLTSINRM